MIFSPLNFRSNALPSQDCQILSKIRPLACASQPLNAEILKMCILHVHQAFFLVKKTLSLMNTRRTLN